MPKLSASALKARIDQLQKQLAAAEANKAPAIKKVRALMAKLGVTIGDLQATKTPNRRGRPAKVGKANGAANGNGQTKPRRARAKVAIKYRDNKGNTWTGRGKTPRWLVEAEKAGQSREAFRIS
jgi:DNA-binding protein H-NS